MIKLRFRLADSSDKASIAEFMDENWGSRHPLIHVDEFFNYYYANNDKINFALAETEDEPHTIAAVCGFIPCNRERTDIWISIWCAKKEKALSGAGLELMSRMQQLCGARVICCNNIRPNTMGFYRLLGYTADRIPHFYRLAKDKAPNEYRIAKIKHIPPVSCIESDMELIPVNDINSISACFTPPTDSRPYKDLWHINRRYFNYPFQKYNVYLCRERNCENAAAVLVIQKVITEGTVVLRIVDYIGAADTFAKLCAPLGRIMLQENAEYLDCYVYGVSNAVMQAAGFCERLEDDENIIPNYLTPPLYENTEYYFFTSDDNNFTLWKADGDQNRPNIG